MFSALGKLRFTSIGPTTTVKIYEQSDGLLHVYRIDNTENPKTIGVFEQIDDAREYASKQSGVLQWSR